MKTAREYIMESNEGDTFYNVICNLTEDQILDAIKEYARQVATQTLQDASENAMTEYDSMYERIVDKDSILRTEIKTP